MIRSRDVLDAIRDAVFLADVETGIIIDANRAAESLCGRSITELRLLHLTELQTPESLVCASSRGLDPHVWLAKTAEDPLEMGGPHYGVGGYRRAGGQH